MSDTNWGDAESAPPKKKGLPTWLWFCGGGCLLAVIVGIVFVTWFVGRMKEWQDPEKQWPKVAQVLPYDERPPELELEMGAEIFGMRMYFFSDRRGFAAVLMRLPVARASDRDKTMDPNTSTGIGPFGARQDAKASKVSVQGRELQSLRFFQLASKNTEKPDGSSGGSGPTALVDLSQDGEDGFLLLQLTRTQGTEEIADEEIVDFLKPFHVGPVR